MGKKSKAAFIAIVDPVEGRTECEIRRRVRVWHDMWPEISVLLFLLFMSSAMVIAALLTQ